MKSQRRAGRPASTREDVLRIKIARDEKEWENGFCQFASKPTLNHDFEVVTNMRCVADLPDLTLPENVVYLDRWDGSWAYLPTLKWVIIAKDGTVKQASFPPKGKH